MREIEVRNLILGRGRPKICVPVAGKDREEISRQADLAKEACPDLVEWRGDDFENLGQLESVRDMAGLLREKMPQIPLLFTVRTEEEGGNFQKSVKDYVKILEQASCIPEIDLIDVEIMKKGMDGENLIRKIHQGGKKTVLSNHHFEGTPDPDEMRKILRIMDQAGGDFRKLAVMPTCPADVINLMKVTEEAGRGEWPVITMAMGQLGKITRIAGILTGSCVTFASAGKASAPGQMKVEEVRKMMNDLE